jgi:hypothetical protein
MTPVQPPAVNGDCPRLRYLSVGARRIVDGCGFLDNLMVGKQVRLIEWAYNFSPDLVIWALQERARHLQGLGLVHFWKDLSLRQVLVARPERFLGEPQRQVRLGKLACQNLLLVDQMLAGDWEVPVELLASHLERIPTEQLRGLLSRLGVVPMVVILRELDQQSVALVPAVRGSLMR